MAGTFTIKALGDGQLAAKAALYTVLANTAAIVLTITLVNTHDAAVTVNLYINATGASRRIIPEDMPLAADGGSHIFSSPLTLEAGDMIEGDASQAAVVDYTINGVEET